MAKRLNPKEQYIANVMGKMRIEEFREICDNVVPCVYAALAMSLYEKGWRYERINNLFARSQEIWQDNCLKQGDMMDRCFEMTGIDVRIRVDGKGE